MSTRTILVAAAGVAALAATAAGAPAHAAATGVPASATGSGQVDTGSGLRTFSFTAVTGPNGVTGMAQIDNRASGVRVHVVVSCLAVSGNTAYVGGNIDASSNAGLVGAPAVFAVQDGGEGGGAAPDQITGLFVGDSACASPDDQSALAPALFPIQEGNVQVR